jgi:hypothetical protein
MMTLTAPAMTDVRRLDPPPDAARSNLACLADREARRIRQETRGGRCGTVTPHTAHLLETLASEVRP